MGAGGPLPAVLRHSPQRHHEVDRGLRAAALFAQVATRPGTAAVALSLLKRFPDILTFGAQLSGKAKDLVAAA